MVDKLSVMTLQEIKNGFSFYPNENKYICNICGDEYESGEIYTCGERFFDAEKMVRIHIENKHHNMLEQLCSYDKKYTGITDNQKELLNMIYNGMSDNEIAKKTGLAPATIRHQRFVFREKAKQAKLYLAIYEIAIKGTENKGKFTNNDEMIEIHKGAKMVDDRYILTKSEEEKIIQSMFSTLIPLKLKTFSSKEKKKLVILKKISEQFEIGRKYSEQEINSIIKEIYSDYVTIRRYLIEYGFMDRTNDCKEYWLK